jgi:hypothetical protein
MCRDAGDGRAKGLARAGSLLVLRRPMETGELKTYLCHAPRDTALATQGRMSGMRWPIETCFEAQLALEMLAYQQQRNHAASLSHRKRRIALVTRRE